jgi:hypothetical protein
MAIEVHVNTIVLLGGRIEISIPKLVAGQRASVIVTVEDQEPVEQRHVMIYWPLCPVMRSFRTRKKWMPTYVRSVMHGKISAARQRYCLPRR